MADEEVRGESSVDPELRTMDTAQVREVSQYRAYDHTYLRSLRMQKTRKALDPPKMEKKEKKQQPKMRMFGLKDPVFLHWSEENAAFFSEEKHVPCGDYAGHVIVEGKTYPVEGFGVRSYTFEVDLFIKEDLIEDEVATSNSLAEEIKFRTQQQQYQKGSIDTYKDISTSALTAYPRMEENGTADENGIRHNSKYEELLRQQLQHKESLDASLEN
nr:hypothetical protein BaRGS_001349 [Batillaria attramentaria]